MHTGFILHARHFPRAGDFREGGYGEVWPEDTAQTRAVKKLKADIRIAMSGTPVENRLSEYWSIFDFTNKCYLGNLKKFTKEYAFPIEVNRDKKRLDRFLKITAPFILRRLKSDKSIISDLPEKVENDSVALMYVMEIFPASEFSHKLWKGLIFILTVLSLNEYSIHQFL